jgi:hypothetical protein
MPDFGEGKFVRVFGRQGKLEVYKKYFYGFSKQKATLA